MKKLLLVGLIFLLLSACIPSQEQIDEILSAAEKTALAQVTFVPVTYTPNVETVVAQTFSAMTANAPSSAMPDADSQAATVTPAPTVTATPAPGSISGKLSYPSSFLPPLRVIAFRVDGEYYRYVDTLQNQSAYQITGLAPGLYRVVAYTLDGALAGGYSQMVPCGLLASCADHSLIEVEVKAGQDTPNVDPADWYAPEGSFPPMPDASAILSTATADGPPALTGNGGIAGQVGYPSSGIPPMRIVAFRVGDFNEYYSITTGPNENAYSMSLPPGKYYVVAYVLGGGLAGGYTQAVVCGLTAACTDHSLIAVQVSSMVVLHNDVNLMDWYAPDGTFPSNPYP
ncbi:MAG: hypothetical protein HFACDABA_00185 [Anaerolineales bacterium]|nr:hypothetical protein [Anaerolineales bacterium]